ncbi:MAG: carbamate kinase [Acidipropionibacterium acidipropionici]|jgi:carbamate kinase|uniref:Carbamate kinase n=1 Tax=Acidipropionibacterium acidipropionici (strain ATCC 4875 / DSM 20272 / JCM 6432 / NBRC 12425 / NCIMB 8070 / 4) TaxID=1171373 RepID=K7RQ41_ACIA4|nr:hypothetical protein [Acidipropionibacterium acidipropionici]AFV88391.1 Carbamate kinase [Acidipropionibacterium acidipropionici ATCC 4875]ALN14249.1 carbamate kinase [Acidipropionibacterium acidipropionici]APZ09992.1 carbamate kinase [Acidipropionibacterium acidipropionici]QCV96015.1 carbamate kinase [Acidipropionibacterium acidipropionici]
MRVVIGVGGNAIAPRGQANTVADQRAQIRRVCGTLLDVAAAHELVITHGNGPQVGMLALQKDPDGRAPLPLDVLGAETQGMIGYLIETELRNEMTRRSRALTKQQRARAHRDGEVIRSGGAQRLVTTVLTLAEVSLDDPAFDHPTKFVGPVYTPEQARALADEHGWVFADDGGHPRRVVPSPRPRRIIQVDSTKQLLAAGHIVICTGGGGIPIARDPKGYYVGVEAVLDKDASSALFAAELKADVLVLATDADAVMADWGTPDARPIRQASVAELEAMDLAEGSMGPKVKAGCDFVAKHGGRAVIGRLSDLEKLVAGTAGTSIVA